MEDELVAACPLWPKCEHPQFHGFLQISINSWESEFLQISTNSPKIQQPQAGSCFRLFPIKSIFSFVTFRAPKNHQKTRPLRQGAEKPPKIQGAQAGSCFSMIFLIFYNVRELVFFVLSMYTPARPPLYKRFQQVMCVQEERQRSCQRFCI